MKSRLTFFIALRYFFSRKSQRVINIISMIAATGVMIGTAALIIVLSVFNGFEDLIVRLYNSFDPDLKIERAEGKSFETGALDMEALKKISGVEFVNEVIEESALARYHDKQYIVRLKGVGKNYEAMTGMDTMIVEGNFQLEGGDTDYAVIGSGVAYNLEIDPMNIFNQVEIYGAKRSASSASAFNRRYIIPSGVFSVQQEFDSRYIIVPLRFAKDIFEYEGRLTSVEVSFKKGVDKEAVTENLSRIAGKDFIIKDRFMQHELMYKIMRSEKWAVFLILTFILIIAIFNVISSLTMLVIEKKKDIGIYRSMGADISLLRAVFLTEGMFITLTGSVTGLLLGMGVCFLQEKFGLIELNGSGSFVIDAYPVKMLVKDFIYVFLTVTGIGFLAALYPAKRLIREENVRVSLGEE